MNNILKYEEYTGKRQALDECGENSAKAWKKVKSILNWASSDSPNQLFHKDLLRTKSSDIGDSQNEYFVEKVQKIRENIPPPLSDPLSKLRTLMTGRTCSFSLAPVHPDQVEKLLSSLNNSTSFGLDQIDTFIIKLVKGEILPAVTHIINLSISAKTFPGA